MKKKVVDTPINAKIQKSMQELKQKCDALTVMLDLANMYLPEDEYEKYLLVIQRIGFEISHDCCELKRMEPNLTGR